MENEGKEPAPKYNYLTIQEYLEMERNSGEKHEYYEGEIFSMSGASINHNRISMNLSHLLKSKLDGQNCEPFGSDLRIHVPKNTLYTYPDFSIICGDLKTTDDKFDTVVNPTVIVEILSPSTQRYDRLEKFSLYRDIETFKEYILVDSRKLHIQKHQFTEEGWLLSDYKNINDAILINAVNISFSLKDIYKGISF
jgi:Uma2 family endonuclease